MAADAADRVDPIAQIEASPPGPKVGAFFDLDGTLVDGFTATAHAGDRIRRRQARIGEVMGVIEASMRYKFGRMHFERLLVRAAGYLRGESLAELDEIGERLFGERVARFLEIGHVLCNHFDVDAAGRLTGEITKPVIWGRQKAAAVQQFCAAGTVDLTRSYFYADGDEDAAL